MAWSKSRAQKSVAKAFDSSFAEASKNIRIIEDVEADNGRGGKDTSRVLFATARAFVFPMAGKENVEAGGLYSDQMFKFLMEPVAGLTNKMIIEYTNDRKVTNDYKIESDVDIVEVGVLFSVIAEKDKPSG